MLELINTEDEVEIESLTGENKIKQKLKDYMLERRQLIFHKVGFFLWWKYIFKRY